MNNKIESIQKLLDDNANKIEKDNKQKARLQEEIEKLTSELEQKNKIISQYVEEHKNISDEKLKLQSQTNNNNKINEVLSE